MIDIATLLNNLQTAGSDQQLSKSLRDVATLPASVDAIVAIVRSFMSVAVTLRAPLEAIDVCGTGGDHRNTLNVSTAVAFVAASSGARVAKHGNRAASSRSGATDVLNALKINTDLSPDAAMKQLEVVNLTFLSAPNYHPALVRLAPFRKALGRPTLLNVVGPLLNPFQVQRQLIGVYKPELVSMMAEAARQLGRSHVWTVCSGTDELSVSGENEVVILDDNKTASHVIDGSQFGFPTSTDDLTGADPAHNAEALVSMLEGKAGIYRETVLFNAAASLVIAHRAADLSDGIVMAREAIDSGAALLKLRRMQDWE